MPFLHSQIGGHDLPNGEPGECATVTEGPQEDYDETQEASVDDVQRPAGRPRAGGLRVPGRHADGDACAAYGDAHPTHGDACATHGDAGSTDAGSTYSDADAPDGHSHCTGGSRGATNADAG